MKAMKYWLITAACLIGIASLAECARAAESNTQSWGLDAINDYIDKANVLVGDESGDFCSGTVISIKNRFILTANHCVQDRVRREDKEFVDPVTGEVTTRTIEKTLDLVVSKNIMKNYEVVSRQSFTAKIWARDPDSDVAILQIVDPTYVPAYAASLAPDEYQLKRGETIYVIGNPGIQFDNSISKGIVSATERTLDFGDGKKVKVFQTDAVAIGGNSGGSVLNEKGQIIGTLDAGLKSGGITFVVPIEATKKLLKNKGFRDTEGPGVGAKPSPNQIDQKSSEIDRGFAPLKARPILPIVAPFKGEGRHVVGMYGLTETVCFETLWTCLEMPKEGAAKVEHLDVPKTQDRLSSIPACISAAMVDGLSKSFLLGYTSQGHVNGITEYQFDPVAQWTLSLEFKDGCMVSGSLKKQ